MDCKPSRFVKVRFLDSLSDAGTMTDYQRCHFNYGNKESLKIPLICINIINCCFFDRLSILQFRRQAHGKPTFSIRTTLLYHCVGSSLFNIEFTDQSALFKQMSLSIGQTFYVMYTEMPKRQRYDAVQYRKQL